MGVILETTNFFVQFKRLFYCKVIKASSMWNFGQPSISEQNPRKKYLENQSTILHIFRRVRKTALQMIHHHILNGLTRALYEQSSLQTYVDLKGKNFNPWKFKQGVPQGAILYHYYSTYISAISQLHYHEYCFVSYTDVCTVLG